MVNCAVLQCAHFKNVESNHELTFVVGNTNIRVEFITDECSFDLTVDHSCLTCIWVV